MSEDVKPRKFWVEFNPKEKFTNGNWHNAWDVPRQTGCPIQVIELEPTMRMMDELANKLQILDDLIGDLSLSPNPESNTIRMEITYDILEKYRKFKEGLK